MKKFILFIISFLVFIPFVKADVTFEEIKNKLESVYDNIDMHGSFVNGEIVLKDYEKYPPIIINNNIFSFFCGFGNYIIDDENEFYEKANEVAYCKRYEDIIIRIASYIIEKNNYGKNLNTIDYLGYEEEFYSLRLANDNHYEVSFPGRVTLNLNEFKLANNIPSFDAILTSDNKIKLSIKTNNSKLKNCEIYKSTDNTNYILLKSTECVDVVEIIDEEVNVNEKTYYYKSKIKGNYDYSEPIKIELLTNSEDNPINNTTNSVINNTTNGDEKNESKTPDDNASNITNNTTKDGRTNPKTGDFISIISITCLISLVIIIAIYTGKNKKLWRI